MVPHANHDGPVGVRIFPLGTQLTYSCADGYNIDGFFRAMCVGEGRWVGPRMTCSRKCFHAVNYGVLDFQSSSCRKHGALSLSIWVQIKEKTEYIDTQYFTCISASSSLSRNLIGAINFQPEDVHILEIFRMAEEKEMCLSFPIE